LAKDRLSFQCDGGKTWDGILLSDPRFFRYNMDDGRTRVIFSCGENCKKGCIILLPNIFEVFGFIDGLKDFEDLN